MNIPFFFLIALWQLPLSTSIKCYVGFLKWAQAKDCDSSTKFCMKTASGQLEEYKCADSEELNNECIKIGGAACSQQNYSATGFTYSCCNSDYCVEAPSDYDKIFPIVAIVLAFLFVLFWFVTRKRNDDVGQPATQETPDGEGETLVSFARPPISSVAIGEH
jgi:hypothetical protein